MRSLWMVTLRMVRIIGVVGVFVLPAITSTKSPKEVVEQFIKMDADGLRLTPEGWRSADALFAKPSEPFLPRILTVIARGYAISTQAGGPDTTVYMGYIEVGEVDALSLHFTPINKGFMNEFDKYNVVLTDAYGAADDNKPGNEGNGSRDREWKIEGTQPKSMRLTPEAAINYIKRRLSKISDASVKNEGEQTLKRLASPQ